MEIRFLVEDDDIAAAGRSANLLADMMKEVEGVESANRSKDDIDSMDLGTVVSVVATSGAALAIANGLASWLRARRGSKVTIELTSGNRSIKSTIEGVDPEVALKITEIIVR